MKTYYSVNQCLKTKEKKLHEYDNIEECVKFLEWNGSKFDSFYWMGDMPIYKNQCLRRQYVIRKYIKNEIGGEIPVQITDEDKSKIKL